jgi:hypothetical protein
LFVLLFVSCLGCTWKHQYGNAFMLEGLGPNGEAVFTSPTSVMLGKVPTSLFFILEETGLG